MGTLRLTKLWDITTWAQIFQFQAEGGPTPPIYYHPHPRLNICLTKEREFPSQKEGPSQLEPIPAFSPTLLSSVIPKDYQPNEGRRCRPILSFFVVAHHKRSNDQGCVLPIPARCR